MATTVQSPVRTTNLPAAARYVAGLEELAHYYGERGLEDDDLSLTEVRFAESLARYRLSPPPGKMIAERLHVMVFGGAGAGKSTVANILVGAEVAEVNAQAGYTRHPVAYCRSETADADLLWPERLGGLARDDAAGSAHVHRDCFGWRPLAADLADPGFFRRHVVWDGPDLTAKDATYYESRVVEIAALADVCVYVASDERYNDELPTNFLQTMLDAGKWVVVALTKVGEEDADEFVRLFRSQVVARLRHADRLLAVIPIAAPADGDVARLWCATSGVGIALRDAIERATGDFADARHSGRAAAGAYLKRQQGRLLEPLRKDLGEWQSWMEIVRKAANEAVRRYEREYLVAARYPELDETLEHVLGGFALTGKLRHLGQALDLLRTPWRLLKGLWQRFAPTRAEAAVEEERVLERLRQGMLESVQVACSAWRSRHPLWRMLHDAVQHEAPAAIEPAYAAIRDRRERELKQRILATARSVHEGFWKSPLTAHGLHAARVLLDVLAILLAVYVPFRLGVYLLAIVLVPLFVGLVDELVRAACRVYVERQRTGLVRQQKESVRELVRTAYIEPLLRLPKSQGGRFVGLSRLAEAIPALLEETMAALAIDRLPSE